ncbi:MAG: twin-arginine translocase subunit TatC [Microbacteriaceae bacterium]
MTTVAGAQGRMPLQEHLREARKRLIRAASALAAATVIGYLLSGTILDVLREPIEQLAESRNASLNYDSITGAFDLKLQIAILAGVVLASPLWLYELLAYIAPGLTRREKRFTYGFLFTALPLFLAGCTAGVVLLPHMVSVLTSFASSEDSTILTASTYVGFALKLAAATGLAFVLPVFVVLLNFAGILSARTIGRSWRLAVVAIVLFSALVTPSADVLSMFLIAVPMSALYLVAVAVTRVHDRRAARRLDSNEAASNEAASRTAVGG